jgi:hypothetical protein
MRKEGTNERKGQDKKGREKERKGNGGKKEIKHTDTLEKKKPMPALDKKGRASLL